MKYIGTFKTTQTMYYRYDSCYWDTDKPDGKCGYDYAVIRNGTKFKAYTIDEETLVDDENYKVELTNERYQIYFEDIKYVHERRWLEEIKNDNTL